MTTQNSPAPVDDGLVERGWLIEHGSHAKPLYWTGRWGRWSGDHKEACRFARREDAAKVAGGLGDTPNDPPHHIVEHAWSTASRGVETTDAARLKKAALLAMQALQSMGDTEEGVTLAFRTLAEAVNG